MRSLRTRLIIIFTAVAFLPMIPIAYLVFDLVQQSYQIGVNSEVEGALRQGGRFFPGNLPARSGSPFQSAG